MRRPRLHAAPPGLGQAARKMSGLQTAGTKIISGFSTPTHLKPLSITDAKKAGFTVYKKLGEGEYERQ